MCESLAEKNQDQALELSSESRNADDYSTSSLLPFELCVKGWLRKGGNAQEEYSSEDSPRTFATLSSSPSFVMASVLGFLEPFPW